MNEKKGKSKSEQTKVGISPKLFHKILDKASKPVKKSEKEKS